ncbi:MAG: MscL family protein [Bacilli bacterium]|nr:MscL family protein [Bacilli bacterium]
MSVGVVIGSAFGAIVTALTNIFLSICTWAVPGGLKGLITILSPASLEQAGLKIGGQYVQYFANSRLDEMIKLLGGDDARQVLMSNYTLHGSIYVYNGASVVDWGAFINAALSFLVIAFVLFMILRIIAKINKIKLEAEAKALEKYYQRHPDERPAPEDPAKPEPTEKELLKNILAVLKKNEKRLAKEAKKK